MSPQCNTISRDDGTLSQMPSFQKLLIPNAVFKPTVEAPEIVGLLPLRSEQRVASRAHTGQRVNRRRSRCERVNFCARNDWVWWNRTSRLRTMRKPSGGSFSPRLNHFDIGQLYQGKLNEWSQCHYQSSPSDRRSPRRSRWLRGFAPRRRPASWRRRPPRASSVGYSASTRQ